LDEVGPSCTNLILGLGRALRTQLSNATGGLPPGFMRESAEAHLEADEVSRAGFSIFINVPPVPRLPAADGWLQVEPKQSEARHPSDLSRSR
jgi:hypothetical protein